MLNTKSLFTKLDFEFLAKKSDLEKNDLISGHENEAKIFPLSKTTFDWNYFPKLADYNFFFAEKKFFGSPETLVKEVDERDRRITMWRKNVLLNKTSFD